jgi:hypothetical protein
MTIISNIWLTVLIMADTMSGFLLVWVALVAINQPSAV